MDPADYLSLELQRIDLLLHREILRLRARYQLSLDEFRGLYISDEQVNQLVNRVVNHEGFDSATDALTKEAELLRANANSKADMSPWHKLVAEFSLSDIEQEILLLALAPDIDLKYETLFAYLNNDVTRKWPTFDLALRVGASRAEQRSDVHRCLLPESKLFSSGLVHPINSISDRRSWLATGFSAAPAVRQYLSHSSSLDPRLRTFVERRRPSLDWEQLPVSADLKNQLRGFSRRLMESRSKLPVIIFVGPDGVGRTQAAEQVCQELGVSSLLRVDLDVLRSSGEHVGELTRALLLHQRLHAAGLYLDSMEALFDKEQKLFPESRLLFKILTEAKGPVFIPCEATTYWRELFTAQRSICFRFDLPDFPTRRRLWENAIATADAQIAGSYLDALADRFVLTPVQIAAAAESALDARYVAHHETAGSFESALFEAARAQSDQSLGALATKVKTIHSWNDLILPHLTLQRVKEISAAIRQRHVVYSEWGFEARIAAGLGLKVLFSGASGTGKTMTAAVIARDLDLDLYRIDLSGIVSKYIGETEKNLDRIFSAAQCSNAILFFDEADALFGKRSEVKNAHDRYANIEVAYLLQKIEEYEGVVILASNLSKNIDEAFSRRMHYVVEFPLPNEAHRERLWRGMFPAQVPLGEDVDFQFLAKQFSIAGGDIRNVALEAAFLAAQNGKIVTMKQLATALARQMIKQGKIPSATEFKQHHGLIVDGV
jgi:SpoVK/Ycf46/Vps4 family AAA+-type ATPase